MHKLDKVGRHVLDVTVTNWEDELATKDPSCVADNLRLVQVDACAEAVARVLEGVFPGLGHSHQGPRVFASALGQGALC